jgi:hypothetical protein
MSRDRSEWWSCTSTSLYVIISWCLMKHRDDVTYCRWSPVENEYYNETNIRRLLEDFWDWDVILRSQNVCLTLGTAKAYVHVEIIATCGAGGARYRFVCGRPDSSCLPSTWTCDMYLMTDCEIARAGWLRLLDCWSMGWLTDWPAVDHMLTAWISWFGKFLSSCATGDLLRRAQLHGVSYLEYCHAYYWL